MQQKFDALIIGAGISGLALGLRLKKLGKSVLIIEKSGGVGGRVATRRAENCVYDHGAQFIKLTPSQFSELKEIYPIGDIAKIWFKDDLYLYVAFEKGITQFAKRLAENQNVLLKEKVILVEEKSDEVEVKLESAKTFTCQKVYLTCPLPQSIQLLKDSKIDFPQTLLEIQYTSALIGLFSVQSANKNIEKFKYQQDIDPQIFSVSNQLSKNVSAELCFTVTMQPDWSQLRFGNSDEENLAEVQLTFEKYLHRLSGDENKNFKIIFSQLKKWRYCQPLKKFEQPSLILPNSPRVQLLGDCFGGGSVRGCALFSS